MTAPDQSPNGLTSAQNVKLLFVRRWASKRRAAPSFRRATSSLVSQPVSCAHVASPLGQAGKWRTAIAHFFYKDNLPGTTDETRVCHQNQLPTIGSARTAYEIMRPQSRRWQVSGTSNECKRLGAQGRSPRHHMPSSLIDVEMERQALNGNTCARGPPPGWRVFCRKFKRSSGGDKEVGHDYQGMFRALP